MVRRTCLFLLEVIGSVHQFCGSRRAQAGHTKAYNDHLKHLLAYSNSNKRADYAICLGVRFRAPMAAINQGASLVHISARLECIKHQHACMWSVQPSSRASNSNQIFHRRHHPQSTRLLESFFGVCDPRYIAHH